MTEQLFSDLADDFRRGTVLMLGLMCLLAFLVNLGVLLWLVYRSGGTRMVRCPECGRSLTCPHCAEDLQKDTTGKPEGGRS